MTAAASTRVANHFHPATTFISLGSCETHATCLGKSGRMGALGTVPAWEITVTPQELHCSFGGWGQPSVWLNPRATWQCQSLLPLLAHFSLPAEM